MDPSIHARATRLPWPELRGPVEAPDLGVNGELGSDLPPEAAGELEAIGAALRDGELSLSPECLISVADNRLGDVDAQIGRVMLELRQRAHEAETSNAQIQGLQALRGAMVSDGATDAADTRSGDLPVQWQGEGVTVDSLIERLGLSEDLQRTDDGGVRLGAVDALIEQKKAEVDQVNSSNELQMITLQSLMSQRTQVIELVTRMLRAVDASREAIVRNLGT